MFPHDPPTETPTNVFLSLLFGLKGNQGLPLRVTLFVTTVAKRSFMDGIVMTPRTKLPFGPSSDMQIPNVAKPDA